MMGSTMEMISLSSISSVPNLVVSISTILSSAELLVVSRF